VACVVGDSVEESFVGLVTKAGELREPYIAFVRRYHRSEIFAGMCTHHYLFFNVVFSVY